MTDIHTFDKACWHSDSDDYPEDIDETSAFTHAGFFLGWLISRHLISDEFSSDYADDIARFKQREITGPALFQVVDGVLTSILLSDLGNHFALDYFDLEDGEYLSDYESLLAERLPSLYHVEDSWANFDVLAERIDERFKLWRKRSGSRWWRFGSRRGTGKR